MELIFGRPVAQRPQLWQVQEMAFRVSMLVLVGVVCVSAPTPGEGAVRHRCQQLLQSVVEEQEATHRRLQGTALSLIGAPIVVNESGVTTPAHDHGIGDTVERLDALFDKVVELLKPQFREQARAIYHEQRYVHYTDEFPASRPSSWMLGLQSTEGRRFEAEPEVWFHQAMRNLRVFKRLHLFEFAVRFGIKSEFISGNRVRAAVLLPGHTGSFTRFLDAFTVELNHALYQHVALEVARADLSFHCSDPGLQAVLFTDFQNRQLMSLGAQLEMLEAIERQ